MDDCWVIERGGRGICVDIGHDSATDQRALSNNVVDLSSCLLSGLVAVRRIAVAMACNRNYFHTYWRGLHRSEVAGDLLNRTYEKVGRTHYSTIIIIC